MVDTNTRQGKRTPVTLKIKFKSETLEQFIERYAIDVSQGGIFIRTKEPLPVGTQMKFEFQLRDASPLIAGEGTVVWTRENDPSRPAIAPGMGVRFDRLADGSQGILERILAEKAKQAPQRPAPDTTKPPLFSDTPTRVAPAPMQEALLGKDHGRMRRDDSSSHNDSHTPLPKPMPFHSDADEFPDEAFEEATKVRALDELIAQTAEASQSEAARRGNGRSDAHEISDRAETLSDDPITRVRPPSRPPQLGVLGVRPDAIRLPGDPPEAPDLPSPPEPAGRPSPRLLDTSPSPRFEAPALAGGEALAKTKLGFEPARGRTATPAVGQPLGPSIGSPSVGPSPGPTAGSPILEAPPLPTGIRAFPAEHTEPARMPNVRARSKAPLLILLVVLLAAGAAAVWFLVLRPQQQRENAMTAQPTTPPEPSPGTTPGSAVASGATGPGDGSGSAGAPAAELVETVIEASAEGATVAIAGTDQSGPAPFTARLARGTIYKATITARGFKPLELDVSGGDAKQTAKLVAKPRVIAIATEPANASISVDSGPTGKTTPSDIELTAAQAAKKQVRVVLRKAGYRPLERMVELSKLTEEDGRMVFKLDEKLAVAPVIRPTVPAGAGHGSQDGSSGTGTGSDGDAAATPGTGSGSTPPATPPTGTPPAPGAGSGSAAEPEPEFTKPHP